MRTYKGLSLSADLRMPTGGPAFEQEFMGDRSAATCHQLTDDSPFTELQNRRPPIYWMAGNLGQL